MEKPKYTIKEGVCPFCGNDDVEWYDSDQDGDFIRYFCTCLKCNHSFNVYYELTFDGVSFDDDEGKFHDFDENGCEV